MNITKIKFDNSDLKFEDGFKMMQGKIKGKFDREQVKKWLQDLANMFKKSGRDAKIGVATHYHRVGEYAPALFADINDQMKVWNPTDSPTADAYAGDYIDECVFYVINSSNAKNTHMKPKKYDENASSFF